VLFRPRRLLIAACAPGTVLGLVVVAAPLAGGNGAPWWLAVLLLPFALPPLPALAPSVGRWLATAPSVPRRWG